MFSESLRAFLKPVVPFLDDPDVSEILINGPREIWVEKRGKLHRTEVTFTEEGLLAAARNMAQYVGRPLTEERPRLDARLPDGSRIHVVLAPVARRGTTISIRKFFAEKLTVEKLIQLGSMTRRVARQSKAIATPLPRQLIVLEVSFSLQVADAATLGAAQTCVWSSTPRFATSRPCMDE